MHPVTPLLYIAIGDDGTDSADTALADLVAGEKVIVANGDVALEILLDLGCDETWARARVSNALTGNWPISAPIFP